MHILFADNESAIKMEKNERNSCTGNSKHIDIKYFWVDMVYKKKIRVMYCPTWLVLGDYFTKPLQDSLFKFCREIIMGYKHINEVLRDTRYPLKERVEHIMSGNMSENMNRKVHTEKMIESKVRRTDTEVLEKRRG